MGKAQRFYDARFYRELESTQESARQVMPIVLDLLRPKSIIDIGCGAGYWLAAAMDLGVTDVLGVEGRWALQTALAIPREKFLVQDLTTPLGLNRKFDLAVCLEVAEHLPDSNARTFVQALCEAADKVFFSAAIPGQGGRRHLNEQWPGHWARLFGEFGFDCFDVLRPRIWSNPRVLWYYAQNSLIFARRGALELPATAEPLSLVHPEPWSALTDRLNSPGKLLERLPKAILSVLRQKR